jgi:hypothetical protein
MLICAGFVSVSVRAPYPLGDAIVPVSLPIKKAVGCGIHRWYQLKRQAFKLFNKYAGFSYRAGPLFGRAISGRLVVLSFPSITGSSLRVAGGEV